MFIDCCCFAPNVILFLIGSGIDDMPLYQANILEKPKQPPRQSFLAYQDVLFRLSFTFHHDPTEKLLIVVFAIDSEITIIAPRVHEKSSHDDDSRFISFVRRNSKIIPSPSTKRLKPGPKTNRMIVASAGGREIATDATQ